MLADLFYTIEDERTATQDFTPDSMTGVHVAVTGTGRVVTTTGNGVVIHYPGYPCDVTVDGFISSPGGRAVDIAAGTTTVGKNGYLEGLEGFVCVNPAILTNHGTITGTEKAVYGAEQLTVINDGTIAGGLYGVFFASRAGQLNITNDAEISADFTAIWSGFTNDVVINNGILKSNGQKAAILGSGNDLYDSTQGGSATKPIDLGEGDDTARGGGADDTFEGGAGHDLLSGGGGTNLLRGGAGPDTFDGSGGTSFAVYDDAQGGLIAHMSQEGLNTGEAEGDHFINMAGLWGSRYDDTLGGNASGNELRGLGGNDSISGLDGEDTLYGGAGNDTVDGGARSDWISGGPGADQIDGGEGIDRVSYSDSSGAVTVDLATGTGSGGDATGDTLIGLEEIEGSAYGDTLTGDDGAWNWISAHDGNDTVTGGGGRDILGGDAGNDVLDGGSGEDVLYGGAGADKLMGATDADHLDGEAGNDTIDGGAGGDTLIGKEGDDVLTGGAGNDTLDGGSGTNIAVLTGAMAGYNLVKHLDGSITVTGHDGTDLLRNVQLARFNDQDIDLTALKPVMSGTPTAAVIVGTPRADKLSGLALDEAIYGLAGNDVLRGNGGNDWLYGGAGKDGLTGGAGKDTFVFNTKLNQKTNLDKITDFNVKDDTIWLDNALFKANKSFYAAIRKGTEAKPLALKSAFFRLGEHAKDRNDYVIYDKKKGVLSYDADGSGAKAAVEIALLKKGLKITYHDFFMV